MTDTAKGVELLDVFDERGNHVGVKDRRAVHDDGDWHQVFHCLVVAERPGIGPVAVLQRRSEEKAAFPGYLDLSATGHLAAGESPLDGIRELHEELGTDLGADALVPLGVRRLVDDSGEGTLNRELTHAFVAHDDRPLVSYRPDPTEVTAVVDAPIGGVLALLAGEIDELAVKTAVDGVERADTMAAADLVPGDNYWITLFVMADRFARGLRPLSI